VEATDPTINARTTNYIEAAPVAGSRNRSPGHACFVSVATAACSQSGRPGFRDAWRPWEILVAACAFVCRSRQQVDTAETGRPSLRATGIPAVVVVRARLSGGVWGTIIRRDSRF